MKNLLTDKTLKAFEEWIKNYSPMYRFFVEGQYQFKDLPDSMQYGVIVDFFDSVGIEVCAYRESYLIGEYFSWDVGKLIDFDEILEMYEGYELTRPEARKAAVEKANHLFNQIN